MSFTLLHTESSKGWGGQENRTLNECIGLKKLGVRTLILCQPESILAERAALHAIEVRTCRMRKHYDLPAVLSIMNLIKKEKIDVVSTHSGRDSFLAGLAGRLSSRKPRIVRTRHISLAITSKISYNILPHKVVTTSEYVMRYLINKGVNPDKIVTIHSGIQLERFDPLNIDSSLKKELRLQDNTPLVGTVAILRFKKGYHILLDAITLVLKKMPDVFFVFAGDGPQRKNIEHKIKALELTDRVFLLGMRHDVPNILKSIDVFVMPTLEESHGGAYVESLAVGTPVIGTDVGGVSEVIDNEVNGLLIKPKDPEALASSIIKMLQNRERAKQMGQTGREIVKKRFGVEKMSEKMFELYSSLLDSRCK